MRKGANPDINPSPTPLGKTGIRRVVGTSVLCPVLRHADAHADAEPPDSGSSALHALATARWDDMASQRPRSGCRAPAAHDHSVPKQVWG